MPSPLFLPAAEDTQVTISIGGKDTVTVDIFDIEDSFILAQAKSEDMGTTWKQEYPAIFKAKFKKEISAGQAVLLWEGTKARLMELKKSLLDESEHFVKPGSTPSRATKRK
jgi:prolyl oligopeptidase PreP (S9A serine peptidase family)